MGRRRTRAPCLAPQIKGSRLPFKGWETAEARRSPMKSQRRGPFREPIEGRATTGDLETRLASFRRFQ